MSKNGSVSVFTSPGGNKGGFLSSVSLPLEGFELLLPPSPLPSPVELGGSGGWCEGEEVVLVVSQPDGVESPLTAALLPPTLAGPPGVVPPPGVPLPSGSDFIVVGGEGNEGKGPDSLPSFLITLLTLLIGCILFGCILLGGGP